MLGGSEMFGPKTNVYINYWLDDSPDMRDYVREAEQRNAIIKGWKDAGIMPEDVGLLTDSYEIVTRDLQICHFPELQPDQSCKSPQIAPSCIGLTSYPYCVKKENWYHPDLIGGQCVDGIGDPTERIVPLRTHNRRYRDVIPCTESIASKTIPRRCITDQGDQAATGMGPARGPRPSSYRAEAYGLLSILRFLIRIAEFTGLVEKAGQFQNNHGRDRPIVLITSRARVLLHLIDGTVTSSLAATLRHAYCGPPLREYIRIRNKWSEATTASINWQAHGSALRKQIPRRRHYVKFVHDILPTHSQRNRMDKGKRTRPCSVSLHEDRDHIF